MKRMLVNATQREELRVAMVDGQRLYDLDIEVPSKAQRKSNIYKGRITRIEPSLEAAFVDYGAERHGFLPLKEISPEYFLKEPGEGSRVQIKEVLKEGQEIVVQVEKEERGNKGAALTTYVSLAGRFLVLMPNNPNAGGVSRRIIGDDRDVVRQSLDELQPPPDMGCIVRTAGVGRSTEELKWDLDYLLNIWEAIKSVVVTRPAPFLIYQEGNAIVRALRDYYSTDIGEILIDDTAVYKDAQEFMERVLPQSIRKLKFYEDQTVPLFTRFQIESQIESAFNRSVSLPSGGSIVVDHTEALTAIDINSARATKGEDIEQTALNTNLEAAEEIARQLRLRDLGGLVVIDFIDMGPHRNQRDVENKLREAVRFDRARVQIGKISRFGLLELSRQRLRPSLEESTQAVCPRCNGNGVVRSVESLALAVLRLVGEEARKDRTSKVIARLPVEVANFIMNEKRDWVRTIQENNGANVIVVGDPGLDTPNYEIRRVRDDETGIPENATASYKMVEAKEDLSEAIANQKPPPKVEEPAVTGVLPSSPAPAPLLPPEPVTYTEPLWTRIRIWLFGNKPKEEEQQPEASRPRRQQRSSSRDRRSRSGSDRGSSNRDRGGSERSSGAERDAGERGAADRGNADRSDKSQKQGRGGDAQQGGGSRNRRSSGGQGPSSAGSSRGQSGASSGSSSRSRRSRRRTRSKDGSRGSESGDNTGENAQNESSPERRQDTSNGAEGAPRQSQRPNGSDRRRERGSDGDAGRERPATPEQGGGQTAAEHAGRSEQTARAEPTTRPEQAARPEPSRSEQQARPEQPARAETSSRPEQSRAEPNRSEASRPEPPAHTDAPRRPEPSAPAAQNPAAPSPREASAPSGGDGGQKPSPSQSDKAAAGESAS